MLVIDVNSKRRTAIESAQYIINRLMQNELTGSMNKRFGLVLIQQDGLAKKILSPTHDIKLLLDKIRNLKPASSEPAINSWCSLADGINGVLNIDFRSNVRKIAFLITPGKYKYNVKENGMTFSEYVAIARRKAYELDPLEFYIIGTEGSVVNQELAKFAFDDDQIVFLNIPCNDDEDDCWSRANLDWQIESKILNNLERKPLVILDGNDVYIQVGKKVRFNAGGSYGDASPIVSYGWDFNDDGEIDSETITPYSDYVFLQKFHGFVSVKASTIDGLYNLASMRVMVERDLDGIPDEYDNCPDHTNPDQFDYNDDGIGDDCDPERPTNPEELEEWLKWVMITNISNQEITDFIFEGMSEEEALIASLRLNIERYPEEAEYLESIIAEIKNQHVAHKRAASNQSTSSTVPKVPNQEVNNGQAKETSVVTIENSTKKNKKDDFKNHTEKNTKSKLNSSNFTRNAIIVVSMALIVGTAIIVFRFFKLK